MFNCQLYDAAFSHIFTKLSFVLNLPFVLNLLLIFCRIHFYSSDISEAYLQVKMGDEDSRKIFVGGTRDADEGMLENYFRNFGAIESVKVVYDRETNR